MASKTFAELSEEKEFDEAKLEAVNEKISEYGIEVTKVNIEKLEKK